MLSSLTPLRRLGVYIALIAVNFGVVRLTPIIGDHYTGYAAQNLKTVVSLGALLALYAFIGLAFLELSRLPYRSLLFKLDWLWRLTLWLRKPLWGYKRLQMLLFCTLAALATVHLVWLYGLLSPVPRINESKITRVLDQVGYPSTKTHSMAPGYARLRPEAPDLPPLPWPSIGIYEKSLPPLLNHQQNLAIYDDRESRRWVLDCKTGDSDRRAECELDLRISVVFASGITNLPTRYAAIRSLAALDNQLMGAALKDMALRIGISNGKLSLRLRDRKEVISNPNSVLQVQLTSPVTTAFSNTGSVEIPISALRDDLSGLALAISTDQDQIEQNLQRLCAALGTQELPASDSAVPAQTVDPEDCLRTLMGSVKSWGCLSRPELAQAARLQTCRFAQMRDITYYPFPRSYQSEALLQALLPADTALPETLDRPEDRAFIALLLRSHGIEPPIDPEAKAILELLGAKIRYDYAVILGLPRAGSQGHDRKAIRDRLQMQPQLLPYYRDRAHWGPILWERLQAQLELLGL